MDWLLLRGLSRESAHWGKFPAILAARLPGARTVCLDLPGVGSERLRTSPLSVAALVEDLRRRWQPRGSAAILGISLGGMVALEWCARHPGDFARAIVINSSAGDLSAPWKRIRPGVLGRGFAALGRSPLDRELAILRIITRTRDDLPAIAERWADIARERPMRRGTALRQIIAGARFRAPLRLEPPLLVLSGAGDRLTDPGCSRRLAERLGADHAVHPRAGHELALDDPHWIAEQIASWLDSGAHRSAQG